MLRNTLLGGVAALALSSGAAFAAHPLDGFSGEEIQKINEILRSNDLATDETLFPLIELIEPPNAEVLAWTDAKGKTWVAYTKPSALKSRYKIKGKDDVFKTMTGALAAMTGGATGAAAKGSAAKGSAPAKGSKELTAGTTGTRSPGGASSRRPFSFLVPGLGRFRSGRRCERLIRGPA